MNEILLDDTLNDESRWYDATLSGKKLNLVIILFALLLWLLTSLPYGLRWGESLVLPILGVGLRGFLVLMAAFITSVFVHEWLHAVGFRFAGKAPAHSIHYGFNWKAFAAYAHCDVPMKVRGYRVGIALPALFLGVIPAIAGFLLGIWWLSFWAVLMLMAAGGDIAVLLAIRDLPDDVLVKDHPTEVGCLVLKMEE